MSATATDAPESKDAPRSKQFILVVPEARVLEWIARRLPGFVKPDHLTALGVLASVGIAAAYVLSNGNSTWLWAASALLMVHWLGDSLDGTLARVRRAERPRYGFYLDHLVDAFATAAIGIGIGLSPYMLLSVGLAIVLAYLILSINTYLETHAFGVFNLGYGRLGPTEARLILIVANILLVLELVGTGVLDLLGLGLAAAMIVALIVRGARNLRKLAKLEPAS
jgi:phosphatidylglycerophosphate synthase